MGIIKSILTPMTRQWVEKNQQVDLHVAISYLSSAVTDFGMNFFQKALKVPTWAELAKIDKKFLWGLFLESPINLFN